MRPGVLSMVLGGLIASIAALGGGCEGSSTRVRGSSNAVEGGLGSLGSPDAPAETRPSSAAPTEVAQDLGQASVNQAAR